MFPKSHSQCPSQLTPEPALLPEPCLPDIALVDRGSGFTEAWNTGKGEKGSGLGF